jgi:hypothetical protein
VRRRWLAECRLVCAVGSTRRESIEVDAATFGDAAVVVVDSLLAAEEAGDLQQALETGALGRDRQMTLAQLVGQGRQGLGGGYAVFKSVAARYYELLHSDNDVVASPDLASLKQPVSAAGPELLKKRASTRGT